MTSLKESTTSGTCTSEENNPSLEVRKNDEEFMGRFATLYDNKRLSDIILNVGDDRYHAHRFMLVLSSDVFE